MGLEPTTFGITIRRSNQLSYIYQVYFGGAKIEKEAGNGKKSSRLKRCRFQNNVMQSAAKHLYRVSNQPRCNEAVKMFRCALHDDQFSCYYRLAATKSRPLPDGTQYHPIVQRFQTQ